MCVCVWSSIYIYVCVSSTIWPTRRHTTECVWSSIYICICVSVCLGFSGTTGLPSVCSIIYVCSTECVWSSIYICVYVCRTIWPTRLRTTEFRRRLFTWTLVRLTRVVTLITTRPLQTQTFSCSASILTVCHGVATLPSNSLK